MYFVTVGWVFGPVKAIGHITYIVLVQTLNHAQSNFLFRHDVAAVCVFIMPLSFNQLVVYFYA